MVVTRRSDKRPKVGGDRATNLGKGQTSRDDSGYEKGLVRASVEPNSRILRIYMAVQKSFQVNVSIKLKIIANTLPIH